MKPQLHSSIRVLAVSLSTSLAAAATDWTHYRGPNHDGTYTSSIRTNWTGEPPRMLWRVPMDPGLSTFTISGGKVFTQVRRRVQSEDREFIVAMNAADGQELWAKDLDLAQYSGGVGSDDGPRSTPVIDGDRVYVLTSYLRLYCLDATSGSEIWRRDFPAESGATVISWQNAASPVVVGDLILLNANTTPQSLMGVRKNDGTIAWREHNEPMTQATPVVATIAGVQQAVFFTQTGLVSVKPDTGELLWRFPFPYSTSTAASPAVGNDQVFCSAAYGSGSGVVRISATGTQLNAQEVWKRRLWSQMHWASPVYHEGHIYGVTGQSFLSLRCLDMETGDVKWESMANSGGADYISYGSVLKVGGYLMVLSASGWITLVELNSEAYRPIDSFRAIGDVGKCWNNAAINDGILYVRSTLLAAAYDLKPTVGASPRIQLSAGPVTGGASVQFQIQTEDGSAIPAERLNRLRLLGSSDLSVALSLWADQGQAPIVVGANPVFEINIRTDEAARYYVVLEEP